MKYIITITNGTSQKKFESNSRNAKKHLRDNGGTRCTVRNKSGFVLSACEYSDEFGYYYVFI